MKSCELRFYGRRGFRSHDSRVSEVEEASGWLNMSYGDTDTRSQQKDDEHSEAWSRFRSLDWPRTRSSSTADIVRTTLGQLTARIVPAIR
jgi:hypothetical protein